MTMPRLALLAAFLAGPAAAQVGLPPFPNALPVPRMTATGPALCSAFADLGAASCAAGGYPSSAQFNAAKIDIGNEAQVIALAQAQAHARPGVDFNQLYWLEYAKAVEALALARLGATPSEFAALAASVQASLLSAIDAQVGLTEPAKRQFRRIASANKIMLPSDYLQSPPLELSEALIRLAQTCGADGLATNAFSDRGVYGMVLCPGYLIDTAVVFAGLPAKQRLEATEFVMAHELAHTMDNNVLGVAPHYKAMATCLKSQASAHPELFPADLGHKFGELAADFWAVESFRFRHPAGDAEALDSLERGLSLFCGSSEDSSHPSGRFRLEWASRDPDLRASFGCRATIPARPFCSWTGAVR